MIGALWRRVRAALVLGLLWGAAGALGGGLIELIMNILPGSDLFLGVDIWPAALAIPGFLGGVLFSGLLWVNERRRKFEELSLTRFAVWGGLVGLGLGVLIGLPLIVLAPAVLISAGSGAASLALARRGAQPQISSRSDRET